MLLFCSNAPFSVYYRYGVLILNCQGERPYDPTDPSARTPVLLGVHIVLQIGDCLLITVNVIWFGVIPSSLGSQGFMNALLPRLRAATNGPGPIMPFELEVVFA
jgi:hypothetical protein